MKRILLAAALMTLIFCGLIPEISADPPHYTITDLGALPLPPLPSTPPSSGSAQILADSYNAGRTAAKAINDRGQVVGQSSAQAFLWQDGKMIGLGALPQYDSFFEQNRSVADAINPQGQIVGGSGGFWPIVMSGTYDCRAFIYSQNHLRPLMTRIEVASFEPFGINAHGEIAGLHEYRAFYWAHGKLTVLGTLSHVPVGNRAAASGINASGQIVGQSTINAAHRNPTVQQRYVHGRLQNVTEYYLDYYRHGCLWEKRGKRFVMRDLGALPGHPNTEAEAINDKGWVVGSAEEYHLPGELRDVRSLAFLWRDRKMHALEALPGASQSIAHGINNLGQIVGASGGKAVLWQQGKILDLNTVLPENSGWTLQEATAINNHGWIIGNGNFHGQVKAFLLRPS